MVLTVLNSPVSANAFRQVGSIRLVRRQTRDRVGAFDRYLPGAQGAPAADDLQCLVGVREQRAGHGDGPQAADLVTAVFGDPGEVQQRNLLLRQVLHQRVQARVVALEHGDVVRFLLLDQELRVVGLGQQCVEGATAPVSSSDSSSGRNAVISSLLASTSRWASPMPPSRRAEIWWTQRPPARLHRDNLGLNLRDFPLGQVIKRLADGVDLAEMV
jgi:hypothetical protein